MKVCKLGDAVLRTKADPLAEVTEETQLLIQQMFKTMDEENGIGLAAPQVGVSVRIFVLKADDEIPRVFINPQIIQTSPETGLYEEGCLSIPGFYEEVVRPLKITVQAINERGRPFTLEAEGLLARVIQHENDHLDGILFIDRIDSQKKTRIETKLTKKAAPAARN